jgi:sigma-E factor negative regulatory protein RseC
VTAPAERFRIDDTVRVTGRSGMGLRAVLWAFALPLVGMVGAIVGASALRLGEGAVAAVGIAFLSIYYLILYVSRSRWDKRFVFTLHPEPLLALIVYLIVHPIPLLLCY